MLNNLSPLCLPISPPRQGRRNCTRVCKSRVGYASNRDATAKSRRTKARRIDVAWWRIVPRCDNSPFRFARHVIVLNLLCDQGHRFEGWFASGEAFRSQILRHLVHCPHCQTSTVSQLPSAPHVKRGGADIEAPEKPAMQVTAPMAGQLHRALATMARQAENVGARFPEEARRIHHDEAPARAIRGVATVDETRELLDEGIVVLPVPVPPEDEYH